MRFARIYVRFRELGYTRRDSAGWAAYYWWKYPLYMRRTPEGINDAPAPR